MSRRELIKLTDQEIDEFLGEQRVVVCASNGRDGFPHLMPLWYVVRAGEVWAWTYAASQKVKNLERDSRATLQIETGTEYQELRGVMFKANVAIHRDTELVAEIGAAIFSRYGGGVELDPSVREMVLKQAEKRVAMQFVEHARASWDHRKLGGVY